MICSEVNNVEDAWHFDEINEKKKIQKIYSNILNDYTKDIIYDVILEKYSISDIWIYYILQTKFWENRLIQIIFIIIFIFIILKFYKRFI